MKKSIHLVPQRSVWLVDEKNCIEIKAIDVSPSIVGEKAFGLSAIYSEWTLPFFVISSKLFEEYKKNKNIEYFQDTWGQGIRNAAYISGVNLNEMLYVRSNACTEGLSERGKYRSEKCNNEGIFITIAACFDDAILNNPEESDSMPVLVQQFLQPLSCGHISNERRVSKESRDWKGEYETYGSPTFSVALRNWRRKLNIGAYISNPLNCVAHSKIEQVLEIPCSWALQNTLRIHFEWIFDGKSIYIVQADEEKVSVGVNPIKLEAYITNTVFEFVPKVLHRLDAGDAERLSQYSKIQNPLIYAQLNMPVAPIYLLEDFSEIDLLRNGKISNALASDIRSMIKQSLVIRIDIPSANKEERQLLPRTSELRNYHEAVEWLQNEAVDLYSKFENKMIFIMHNFIPAYSSAFAYAEPNNRNVMIEALWGLPEGLYYYSHDKYIVDTIKTNLPQSSMEKFLVNFESGFKKYFVCPDKDGNWRVVTLAAPFDWKPSIPKKDWVKLIAQKTREIADKTQNSISVMWFVGVDRAQYGCDIFPWHHEECTYEDNCKHQNRNKTMFETTFTVSRLADLERLRISSLSESKEKIRNIHIQPLEADLLRDREIIEQIGKYASQLDATIILEGGLLSHAYYQLLRTGAKVEARHAFRRSRSDIGFNKLVRDKVPDKIRKNGEVAIVNHAENDELIQLLRTKLVEEALEVFDATDTEAITNEIADVMEVLDAIRKRMNIKQEVLESIQKDKREKVGGFEEGVLLLKTAKALFKNEVVKTEVAKKGRQDIKIWKDNKKRSSYNESLTNIKIPLTLEKWETRISKQALNSENDLLVHLKGFRNGAEIQLELSIFTDNQISFLSD